MLFFRDIPTFCPPDNEPNAAEIRSREQVISNAVGAAVTDRSERALSRIAAKNRLTAWQRICRLVDSDGDSNPKFHHIGALMSFACGAQESKALGVLCGIGTVCDRAAVIIANDNAQSAGAWFPGSPEKIRHAQDIAARLRIPVIYLVECAGLSLAFQEKTYADPNGAGAIFRRQAVLSKSGIAQLAAVFGDCIAGGGYMPILCDKIVMTEQASLCIGGSAIANAACGQNAARIGGPDVHVAYSGTADARVPDDIAAIHWLRGEFSKLPGSAADFYRIAQPVAPNADIDDLYHIIPVDPAAPFDIGQLIARIADASQIVPLAESSGEEIYACLAAVDGLPAVFIANCAKTIFSEGKCKAGGVLYKEGIQKIRRIASAANEDGIPTVWIQDVAGFEIGENAERSGLLRLGAGILREIADDNPDAPPAMTIILRKASGAGYYAMKGAPFNPAWIVATALARIEVMKSDVLASALYDKKIHALQSRLNQAKTDKTASISSEETDLLQKELGSLCQARDALAAEQEANAAAIAALSRGDVDSFVPLSGLRSAVVGFMRAAWQAPFAPKPKRLWTILDEI